MRCGLLDIAQRDAGIKRGGDKRVAQRVRANGLVDSGGAGDAAHDATRAVAVHPLAIGTKKDRAVESLADREVDRPRGARCQRDGDDLAAVAQDGEGAVAAFNAEGVDVGAESFGDP